MNPCVATVGTFDGVHRGHLAIVRRMCEIAKEKGFITRAITFSSHPLSVIAPDVAPKWAQSRKVSESTLLSFLDHVSTLNFTSELASLTARSFMQLLRERYNVDTLVMGYDNTFGSDRLSSRLEYEQAGKEAGIDVVFVDAVHTPDGQPVSSSRLRKAIASGDIKEAEVLLNTNPRYSAKVVEGKKLGGRIGFPTMNLQVEGDVVQPACGVYAAVAFIGGKGLLPAVLSIGANPTVSDDNAITWEMHVPGHNLGDMYGKTINFMVLDRIRDIKKFDGIGTLRTAIKTDIKDMESIFHRFINRSQQQK